MAPCTALWSSLILLALLLLIRGLIVLAATFGELFTLGLKLMSLGLELFKRRGLLDTKLLL